jgi:hypothetical protein
MKVASGQSLGRQELGDLLGSLVWRSQKWTILCHWGCVVTCWVGYNPYLRIETNTTRLDLSQRQRKIFFFLCNDKIDKKTRSCWIKEKPKNNHGRKLESAGNRANGARPVVGEAECGRDGGVGCKVGFAGEGHWI